MGAQRICSGSVGMGFVRLGLVSITMSVLGCQTLGISHRPAWEQPPPPVTHAPVVQPGAFTRAEFDNGLTVLILEDHRLPRVSIALTARRGAGAVDPDQAGLAEFLAELMNRGAGDRDALALARAVDDMGASLSVSAGWDSVDVGVSGLSSDLDALIGILRDVARRPRLDPEEALKTRSEQLAALEAARDNPATLAAWAAARVLYAGHRYGLPLSGTPESVASLDVEAARALHERYFVARNLILSVVGDVEADAFLQQAREMFGDWASGETPASTPAPPEPAPSSRRIVIVDKPDVVQARIIIAHEGLRRTDERRIPASLMNATLGGSGFSSRLMTTLRSEEGLTYGVGSGFSLRRQPGPFRVSTFTRVPETRRAVDIILAELSAIRGSAPQTADELARAKSFSVGHFGLSLETSEAVMASIVDLFVFDLPQDSLDTYRGRVADVRLDEVVTMARELLHPERAAIVLLGPAEALVPQMQGLGEVEIVSP